MSLIINNNKIVVSPPNSESPVVAQHIGTKARSVGSFYMSELPAEVMKWFDLGNMTYYIDFIRTILEIEKIIGYIILEGKESLFRDELVSQLDIIDELRASTLYKNFIEIPEPIVLPSRKYFKLDIENHYAKIFCDLLLGDCCDIVFEKLGGTLAMIYIEARTDFKEKIDDNFIK